MLKPLMRGCLLSCAIITAAYAVDGNAPVAIINGKTITEHDYENYLKSLSDQNRNPAEIDAKMLMDNLVERELALQDALAKKLDQDPAFLRKMEEFRQNMLAATALNQYLEKNVLTDADLKREYDRLTATKPKEFKAKHVLLKTEDEAKAVIEELEKGKPFDELARAKSTDAATAKNGGDLGWVRRQQVVADFADALLHLEKGKYTKKPVKTEFGWHVIALDDLRDVTPPTFDSVKDQLKNMLQASQMQTYLDGLKKTAKVEILKKLETPAETAAPATKDVKSADIPETDKAVEKPAAK
jgi:peptidyl-prolyl cis-trans isomerase C